jgi:hypothetical protein
MGQEDPKEKVMERQMVYVAVEISLHARQRIDRLAAAQPDIVTGKTTAEEVMKNL